MKRDYSTKIAQGMIATIGQSDYDRSLDLLESCSNPDVKQAYLFAQERITPGDMRLKRKGAYHMGGAIYLDAKSDAAGSRLRKPFSVYFHESGHGVDYWVMQELKRASVARGAHVYGFMYSSYWQQGRFGKTIIEEVQEWVDRVDKQMRAEFKAHKTDLGWLISNGYLKEFEVNALQRRARNLGLSMEDILSGKGGTMWLPSYKKSMAYTAIEDEIKRLVARDGGDFSGASLSDIVEGATKGRIKPGWGHGKSYWQTRGVELEAFAEMCEAYVSGPESLETLRKYLPRSVSTFDEMMVDIAKLIGGK